QTSARLADRAPLLAHPREDLLDDPRLLQDDVVAGRPAPLQLGDVAVAVGGGGQGADRAAAGRVEVAAAAPLQDLGALIFRDDPLNLEQQVVLGRAAQRPVEEDQLNAASPQLLDEE